ncbi:MAG: hypothetical protein WC847_02470 [Candidatus Paceibacterota bacterium]|jgi:hypothetical protein
MSEFKIGKVPPIFPGNLKKEKDPSGTKDKKKKSDKEDAVEFSEELQELLKRAKENESR